jgi:hypothetical protein
LKQSPFDKWYDSGYANYTPSPDTVAELSTSLEAVEVEVYFGTWCSDSTRHVPRLNRVLDDAGFSLDRLEMITLSDRRGEFKLSLDGKERQRRIHRTPTIVISRSGRETTRDRQLRRPGRSLEYDATNEEAKSLEEELSKETDS